MYVTPHLFSCGTLILCMTLFIRIDKGQHTSIKQTTSRMLSYSFKVSPMRDSHKMFTVLHTYECDELYIWVSILRLIRVYVAEPVVTQCTVFVVGAFLLIVYVYLFIDSCISFATPVVTNCKVFVVGAVLLWGGFD